MNENQVKTILRIDSSSSHSHSVTRRLGDELIRRLSLANEGANLLVRDLSGGIRFLSESWAQASQEDARFLVVAGKPLREPVVRGGPFVMNTKAEIEQAFEDYKQGGF
jgi:redox-sensitive bicupin YhaK (pirin superfamily)